MPSEVLQVINRHLTSTMRREGVDEGGRVLYYSPARPMERLLHSLSDALEKEQGGHAGYFLFVLNSSPDAPEGQLPAGAPQWAHGYRQGMANQELAQAALSATVRDALRDAIESEVRLCGVPCVCDCLSHCCRAGHCDKRWSRACTSRPPSAPKPPVVPQPPFMLHEGHTAAPPAPAATVAVNTRWYCCQHACLPQQVHHPRLLFSCCFVWGHSR